jgi:hypothetical protein
MCFTKFTRSTRCWRASRIVPGLTRRPGIVIAGRKFNPVAVKRRLVVSRAVSAGLFGAIFGFDGKDTGRPDGHVVNVPFATAGDVVKNLIAEKII